MYYKLKIEQVDYDKNTIKATEAWVTEVMLMSSHSIDVLKMGASHLIDKFRSDNNLKEPHDEYNVYRNVIESPMINLEQFEELKQNKVMRIDDINEIAAQQIKQNVEKLIDKDIFDQAILAMEERYGSGCEEEIDAYFRGAKWMQKQLKK